MGLRLRRFSRAPGGILTASTPPANPRCPAPAGAGDAEERIGSYSRGVDGQRAALIGARRPAHRRPLRRRRLQDQLLRHGLALGHLQFRRLSPVSRLAVGGRHGALGRTTSAGSGGIVALDKSMYLAPTLNWVGNAMGGVVFGIGMVFAGGCPSRNLARAGAGDLRSLITLIGARPHRLHGHRGLARRRCGLRMEAATAHFSRPRKPRTGGDISGAQFCGHPSAGEPLATPLFLAGGVLVYCVAATRNFVPHRSTCCPGLAVGGCVVAGWALTGLAVDEFAARPMQPASLTYIRPTGDALEWLQRFTAEPVPSFGRQCLWRSLGAGAAAVTMGRFR